MATYHTALWKRLAVSGLCAAGGLGLIASASGETIGLELPDTAIRDESFSFKVRISDNQVALFAYALQLGVDASGLTSGTVTPNFVLTNFDAEMTTGMNLIAQGGGDLDGSINDNLDGTLVASAFNADFGPVNIASPGVNDVLLEVFFDVSADAEGTFTVVLRDTGVTSLTDGSFMSVPFDIDYDPSTGTPDPTPGPILVIPEPTGVLFLALAGAWTLTRRRRNQ